MHYGSDSKVHPLILWLNCTLVLLCLAPMKLTVLEQFSNVVCDVKTLTVNSGYSAEFTVEIVSATSLKVSWHKNDIDTNASTVKYECATPQTDHIAATIERTLPYPETSTYFDNSFCYYDPEKKYKHTATLLQSSTTPSKEPTLTSNSFYIGLFSALILINAVQC